MGQVNTQLRMMSADDQAQYCSSLQDSYVYSMHIIHLEILQ